MLKTGLALALLLASAAAAQRPQTTESSWRALLSGKIPPAASSSSLPARYHFTTEYTMLGPQGLQTGTHVLTNEFLVTKHRVRWINVTVGSAAGHGEPVKTPEHRAYMEGLEYERDAEKITAPEFFAAFPVNANDEKNLVWDELMFSSFVGNLDRLRLNEPVEAKSGDVMLAGSGKFTNRRIELTLTGMGHRNGEDCLLIHYEALLNHFTIAAGAASVSGGSDYFGDIWVSIRTRQIEYGTMLEEVVGVVAVPNSSPQPLHVLRAAKLEKQNTEGRR